MRQADALRRQFIANLGYGVRIGMADSKDYQKAMDELELSTSESKADLQESMWGMLKLLGGGKGV